ncbi:MAG: MGMT family protein [archaeon]|nr:MGMT family protein [archaeon]
MTQFEDLVWEQISKIPKGRVCTYKEIAGSIGNPNAFRAVGNACNKNLNAPKVPCHRVVGSNARPGGYAFGKNKKILLLESEGIKFEKGKIADFEKKLFKFPIKFLGVASKN